MTEAEALQQLAEQRAEIVEAIQALIGVLAISWVGRYFCYALLNGQIRPGTRLIHRTASTKPSVSSSASPSSRSSSTSSCDSSSSDGGSCGGGE